MRATRKPWWVDDDAPPAPPALPERPKIREAYAEFRLALVQRIFSEKLTPSQVATVLEEAADTHKEITYEECRRLREKGDSWKG